MRSTTVSPSAAKPAQTVLAATRAKPAVQAPAQSDVKSATAGAPKSGASTVPQQPTETPQEVQTANSASVLRGGQGTVPPGGFDTRWGAMR